MDSSPENGPYCCRVTNDATCSALLSLAIQNTTEISKHNRTHNIRAIKNRLCNKHVIFITETL